MNNENELNDTLPVVTERLGKIPKTLALKRRPSTGRLVTKTRQRQKSPRPTLSKRVSFQTDKHGDIVRETCELPHQRVLSDEEIANCWWSTEESAATKMEAIALHGRLSSCEDYKMSCRELLLWCSKQIPASACIDHLLNTIIDSEEARGLEFDTIELLQHRQNKAIRTVIATQERMCDIDDWKQRAHMIALRYKKSSLYAREWARWVATGDERVAAAF